jgi:hypothetical protein
VETGSRQENAANQNLEPRSDSIGTEKAPASGIKFRRHRQPREIDMAKGEQRSNREAKKPKKEKIKVIAAAPSQKGAGWQPNLGSDKKK